MRHRCSTLRFLLHRCQHAHRGRCLRTHLLQLTASAHVAAVEEVAIELVRTVAIAEHLFDSQAQTSAHQVRAIVHSLFLVTVQVIASLAEPPPETTSAPPIRGK